MKILFLTWKCLGIDDMTEAFQSLGHEVHQLFYADEGNPKDAQAVKAFSGEVQETSPDIVFSFNFFPVVAMACKDLDLPYFC